MFISRGNWTHAKCRFMLQKTITDCSIKNRLSTFNALARVMAADDEESVIQLSCFLYRVFDVRNRAVSSE